MPDATAAMLDAADQPATDDDQPAMMAMAFQYGLLPPLDWGDDVEAEMHRQVALWNRLVEIEQAHRERVRAVAGADPVVCELDAQVAALRAAPEPDRVALKQLYAELKLARRAAYAAHKPQLQAFEAERRAAVKTARQQSGLWWGNYNAVIESYEIARRQSGELHFRRVGDGRLTNQIQGGMTIEELFEGRRNQVRIGPRPANMYDRGGRRWRSGRRLLTLTLTAFTGGATGRRTVSWPIIMHRPLPDGAKIQYISVHRRRRADGWVWSASLVTKIPAPPAAPPSQTGPVVAINLGWRVTANGLRVATARAAGAPIASFARLPPHLEAAVARCDKAHARMDNGINLMHGWLVDVDTATAPQPLQELIAELCDLPAAHMRAHRLVRLLRLWQTDAPDWAPEQLAELVAWERRNRREWRIDAHRRNWIFDARRKHYEAEAIRLVGKARAVVMNEHDIARQIITDKLPTPVQYHRALAAPSEMRRAILNYCRRIGVPVTPLMVTHDRCIKCNRPLQINDRTALFWSCQQCDNKHFDQDEHYCLVLLKQFAKRAATKPSVEPAPKPRRVLRRAKPAAASPAPSPA